MGIVGASPTDTKNYGNLLILICMSLCWSPTAHNLLYRYKGTMRSHTVTAVEGILVILLTLAFPDVVVCFCGDGNRVSLFLIVYSLQMTVLCLWWGE